MADNGKTINAPLPGKVIAVQVKTGNAVERGDLLLVLEAHCPQVAGELVSCGGGFEDEVKNEQAADAA